ncbi:MAG: hypothetical protein ACD_75C00653G0005 [uncultured bacterium]|nr:MAG: hypothetical protein ACD_75C00653G0005 [uncultured bacterium]
MPNPSPSHFLRRPIGQVALLLVVLAVCLPVKPCPGGSPVEEIGCRETLQLYAALPGIKQAVVAKTTPLIQTLSYTQLRALRAFCRLPDMRGDNAGSVVERLSGETLTYEKVKTRSFPGRSRPSSSIIWINRAPLCWPRQTGRKSPGW